MSQIPNSLNVAMYIKVIFDQCKMCLLDFLKYNVKVSLFHFVSSMQGV